MSQPPHHDPIEEIIELNALPRGLPPVDYRPEATTPYTKPRIKMPLDRASLIAMILIVIVLILVVVWVLHTGGFGTPPVPTPPS